MIAYPVTVLYRLPVELVKVRIMKAWLLDDFTGIGGLRLAETPDPVPDQGEVCSKSSMPRSIRPIGI